MSVKINNLTTTTLPSCIVGTVATTDNSTYAASTAFVNNLVSYLNLLINSAASYTITATKTFTSLLLTNGISSSISIGPTNATQVDVLPSTSASASMQVVGTTQSLQPTISSNVWTSSVVVNSNIIHRIQSGITATTTTDTVVTFSSPFTAGCTPFVIATGNNSAPKNCGVYSITNTSFTIKSTANQNTSWVAIGY
jgi:hypothetical protein